MKKNTIATHQDKEFGSKDYLEKKRRNFNPSLHPIYRWRRRSHSLSY